MREQAIEFVGSIPENYDRCLGPHIFSDYGEELVRRCANHDASKVLELAAGTGIVTRLLRDTLAAGTRLVATDLNPPMLEVAAGKFGPDDEVEFEQADAMVLPFDADSFDLVVCQFGVMFFPDRAASFREAARVLRPGGRYLLNVWGDMVANPFSEVAHAVGEQFFPEDPPRFYEAPFCYSDPELVLADMAAGGLRDLESETIAIDKPVLDWPLFAHGLVFGNPFGDEITDRGGVEPKAVEAAMTSALRSRFGPEPTSMPLLATFCSGTA